MRYKIIISSVFTQLKKLVSYMANKKNARTSARRSAANKSKVNSNLSEQKANKSKEKGNSIEPDLDDGIELSQQLLLKRKQQNTTTRGRGRKTTSRKVPAKKKSFPTLADLEKSYESSDNEDSEVTQDKNPEFIITTPEKATAIDIGSDIQFTPDINVNNMSANSSTPNPNVSPPMKRQRLTSNEDIIDDDLPPISFIKDNPYSTNSENNTQSKTCSTQPVESSDHMEHISWNDGQLNDNSFDSGKTILYDLDSTPPNTSTTFCPLPSTSRDDVTFSKNDELFNESLKRCSFINAGRDVLTNKRKEPTQENHEETQSDEPVDVEALPPPKIEIGIDNEHQDVDSKNNKNETNISHNTYQGDDDDDCVILDEEIVPPIKIDDDDDEIAVVDYRLFDSETIGLEDNNNDEVIDVDAIIAQNESLLNKYKQTNMQRHSSSVIDVDLVQVKPESLASSNVVNLSPDSTVNTDNSIQNNPNNEHNSVDINSNDRTTSMQPPIVEVDTEPTVLTPIRDIVAQFFSQKNSVYGFPPPQNTRKRKKSQTQNPAANPSPQKQQKGLGDCPICMDALAGKKLASTVCGHVFCLNCLEQSLKTNKKCPKCRKIINKNKYHQIYL